MSLIQGVWLQFTAPPDVVEAVRALRDLARRVSGDRLDTSKSGPPHVTLVYLGDVQADQVQNLVHVIRHTSAGMKETIPLQGERIGWFEPSEASGGKIPVYLGMQNPTPLRVLRGALARSVGPWTRAPQFLSWHPHMTLGTLPSGSNPTPITVIEPPPIGWRADTIELRAKGEQILERFSLGKEQ